MWAQVGETGSAGTADPAGNTAAVEASGSAGTIVVASSMAFAGLGRSGSG